MTDPGRLRVGNADRDEVLILLRRAAVEGRLTPEELSERTAKAEIARTYADLDALVDDLPVARPSGELAAQGWTTGRPGSDPANRLVIGTGMSNEYRTGEWEIPPYLRLNPGFGSVWLNCLWATCLAPRIDIEFSGGWIRIAVPDGWGVNLDQVDPGSGTVRNQAPRNPAPGRPQLVLRGAVGMGSLKVRLPSKRERRRLLRRADVEPPVIDWARPDGEMPNADDLR